MSFFVICVLVCVLLCSGFCSCSVICVLVLVSCVFQTLCQKKSVGTLFKILLQILFGGNLAYWKNLGVEWTLESVCLFVY